MTCRKNDKFKKVSIKPGLKLIFFPLFSHFCKKSKNLSAKFIRNFYPQNLSVKFIRNFYPQKSIRKICPQNLSAKFIRNFYPQNLCAKFIRKSIRNFYPQNLSAKFIRKIYPQFLSAKSIRIFHQTQTALNACAWLVILLIVGWNHF